MGEGVGAEPVDSVAGKVKQRAALSGVVCAAGRSAELHSSSPAGSAGAAVVLLSSSRLASATAVGRLLLGMVLTACSLSLGRMPAAEAGRWKLLQEQQLTLSLTSSPFTSCKLCKPSVSKDQALPTEGRDSKKRATMGRSSCWSEALPLLLALGLP